MGKVEGGVGKRCREALHPWTYWLRNREKAGTAWTQSVFCSHCASVLQALSCRPRWRAGELAWQGIKTQTQTKHSSSVNKKRERKQENIKETTMLGTKHAGVSSRAKPSRQLYSVDLLGNSE